MAAKIAATAQICTSKESLSVGMLYGGVQSAEEPKASATPAEMRSASSIPSRYACAGVEKLFRHISIAPTHKELEIDDEYLRGYTVGFWFATSMKPRRARRE